MIVRLFSKPWFRLAGLWLMTLTYPLHLHAQWLRQDLPLRAGWNAVFLSVQPEPADCDQLFAGMPIESVWDFQGEVDLPQFVQDPTQLTPGAPGWRTWYPPGHALAAQRSLFALRDARGYLIKLADGAAPRIWSVTGHPSLRRLNWHSGGLNLVGFPAGTNGPTFQTLFAGEVGLAGQPVYALDPAGVWQRVTDLASARPKFGEAYWIRCVSPAQRTATCVVDTGSRDGLTFDESAAERSLHVRNTSATARQFTLRLLPSANAPVGQPAVVGPVALEYWRTDFTGTNSGWTPLPSALVLSPVAAGQEWHLRLGARRTSSPAIENGVAQSLLEITDDAGTRWVVPIRAQFRNNSVASRVRLAGGTDVPASPDSRAGLWVGEATLRAVSQPAHLSDPATPRPAGAEFTYRLIMQVDDAGKARLLPEAYWVRQPPVLAPDPEHPGEQRIEQPARLVLFTDPSSISAAVGPGEVVGRRFSSAAFAFEEPVALTGGEFGTGVLTGVVSLGHHDPLNPFRHQFHPDHDNLDARYEQVLPEGRESFAIQRTIRLEFRATDPVALNPPGWGANELGGIYHETFAGLHRHAIHVQGVFRLVRVLSFADGSAAAAKSSPGQ